MGRATSHSTELNSNRAKISSRNHPALTKLRELGCHDNNTKSFRAGLVSAVLSQDSGWEEHLQNELFVSKCT